MVAMEFNGLSRRSAIAAAIGANNLDFAPPLEWARAIREQVDWRSVAARTTASPFARTFLTMLEELGVIDPMPVAAI